MFAWVGSSFDQIKNYLGSSAFIGQGGSIGKDKEKKYSRIRIKVYFLNIFCHYLINKKLVLYGNERVLFGRESEFN